MTETAKKSRGSYSSKVFAVLLAAGTVAWIGSGVVNGNEPVERAEEPKVQEPELMPLVRVMQSVAQNHDRRVILFGRTEAINHADIAAEISGRIIKKSVNKGDSVKKGDVLFQIAVEDRFSQLEEAKARLEYQEIAYNAAKRLSKKHFQSQLKLAEEKAELETARAQLKAIQIEVSKTTVRAPIDGVINALPLSVGDYVKSGDMVATLIDLDPIRIVGEVSERDVSRIVDNSPATAVLPDGRQLAGYIKFISRMGAVATRTFDVDVWVENPLGLIPEGLTAQLQLQAETERAHLVSPAVLTLNGDGVVGVKAVNDQGVVVFHSISIVADTPEGVWLGGLPEVVTLITVGQEFVSPDQKVRTATEAQIKNGAILPSKEENKQAEPS